MENRPKQRIHYIDAAKGLLILGVVIIHLLLALRGKAPDHSVINVINFVGFNTWVLFYMPAFFVVSGMCSNFNKDFKSFLLSNIISLKAPIFFFIGILGALAIRPEYGFSPFNIKYWFIRLFESGVWFLHAMFLSRLIYWVIYRYTPKSLTKQFAVCLILYFIGYIGILYNLYPCFWICHSFTLTIFLCIGKFMSETTIRKGGFHLLAFITTVITLNIIGYKVPYIVQEPVAAHIVDSFIILLLSTTGTIGFLWICRLINKSPLLEYIGRYSLMIYLLHSIYIDYFCKQISISNNNSILYVLSAFMITLISVISICLTITYLFDRPYLRLIIGKKP